VPDEKDSDPSFRRRNVCLKDGTWPWSVHKAKRWHCQKAWSVDVSDVKEFLDLEQTLSLTLLSTW